jgi:hypothetical protein
VETRTLIAGEHEVCWTAAFQETTHVHIETKITPKEWWYRYGS